MEVVDQTADGSVHLLIVSSQTFSLDEKHNVLHHINSSLNQIGAPLLSKKEELVRILKNNSIDSNKLDQEYCTEYRNGVDFDFQLLVNSKASSFRVALQDFFKSTFKRKYLILTTSDYNLHGDIHLQDGVFTYDDMVILANDDEVKRITKENKISKSFAYINSKLVESNKNWKNLEKSLNIELVAVKPQSVKMDENLNELAACLSKYYNSNVLCHQLETSKLTGTLRITKPSLYIFPGRTGDSAFFTINGFSMLINGGYERVRPCFWKFVNMLQQIDSILITHTDSDTLGGLSALFAKKLTNPVDVKPHILTVLGNLIGTKNLPQSDAVAAEMASNLIVNEVSHDTASSKSHLSDVDLILDAIDKLKIKLMPLVKTVDNLSSRMNSAASGSAGSGTKYEHINLYYKLGQGSLDLYVLSPFASSADYKEFVSQQQNRFTKNVHQKSHIAVQNYFRQVPLSHACSAVCLLVWLPAPNKSNPAESNALRLLFTGNAPQHVVFNALDKVKDLDVLTLPVYRQKVDSDTSSTTTATTAKAVNSNGVSKKAPATATTNGSSSTVTNANGTNGTSKPGANNNVNSKQPVANGSSHAESTQSKSNSARASTGVPTTTAASSKSSNLTAASNDSTVSKTATNSATTAKPPKSTSNLHSLTGASSAAGADKNKKKAIDGKGDSEQAAEVKTEKKSLKTTNATTSSSNLKKDEKGATSANAAAATTTSASTEKKTAIDSAAAATKPAQSKPPVNKSSTATSSKVTSTASAASSTLKSQSGATSAASGVTKDAAKKTLSLTVTKSASNGAAAAEAPKKDESKIITKRDKPKEVKPATSAAPVSTAPTPVTPKTTTVTTQSMASIAISSPPSAATDLELVPPPQTLVEEAQQLEELEPPMVQPVTSAPETETVAEAAEVVVEATSVELVTEVHESTEAFPAQVEHEVPQGEEATQQPPPPPSETPVEAAFVHIEESLSKSVDILNNSLNQATDQYNQNQQQNVEEEVARSVGNNMHDGGVSHDLLYNNNNESPNLSPVKKDASNNNALDAHNNNNNNHIHHQNGAVNGELSSHENGVSENGGALFTNGNYDIMTTSFIEDSSNPDSNPFNGGVAGRKINLNESENDLNKTHQLSDDGGDAGGEVEEGEIVESINSLKQHPVIDTDALANVLESLNIENHQQNNQIHMLNGNASSAIHENDPNSWNLLQLPKPVNPNDVAVNASVSASSNTPVASSANALPDKKSTPNGKKSLSTAATANPPQSPLNDVSNKPTAVNRNQSASNLKPVAAKSTPVNPVYLELSYVPAHGNSHYCDVEFFKRVRARHFVFSSEELSENTLNALVEGKETWSGGEDKNLPVSIVPTYESEFLRGWFMANQEKLDRLKIDVMPAANMATVTLDENPEMSCQALKIEF